MEGLMPTLRGGRGRGGSDFKVLGTSRVKALLLDRICREEGFGLTLAKG